MKAKQRSDLLISDMKIPVRSINGNFDTHKRLDKWVDSEQPELLNDSEFNVILKCDDGLFLASSIDLDFKSSLAEEGEKTR